MSATITCTSLSPYVYLTQAVCLRCARCLAGNGPLESSDCCPSVSASRWRSTNPWTRWRQRPTEIRFRLGCFGRNHPKMWFRPGFGYGKKGTVELRFRPKLDHVETETSRNWISNVSCSDLQSDDVIFQKQWAGLTVWSESSSSQCLFPTTDAVRGQ